MLLAMNLSEEGDDEGDQQNQLDNLRRAQGELEGTRQFARRVPSGSVRASVAAPASGAPTRHIRPGNGRKRCPWERPCPLDLAPSTRPVSQFRPRAPLRSTK